MNEVGGGCDLIHRPHSGNKGFGLDHGAVQWEVAMAVCIRVLYIRLCPSSSLFSQKMATVMYSDTLEQLQQVTAEFQKTKLHVRYRL
jgi:hypothetical protein